MSRRVHQGSWHHFSNVTAVSDIEIGKGGQRSGRSAEWHYPAIGGCRYNVKCHDADGTARGRRIQGLGHGYPTTPYSRSSPHLRPPPYLTEVMPGTWPSLSTNARTVPLRGAFDRLVFTDSVLSPGTIPSFITLQEQARPFQGWSREAYEMLLRYPCMTGDIFMHKWKGGVQFWVLEVSDLGAHAWKRVRFGYGRSDGKRLSMTEDKRAPAWLTSSWHARTREERRPLMSPL
ncbi:hypothetical protein BC629DRAFT_1535879 [Irpex lacteus]|nr:hypothetical protein BC629DRAFT_1535879 [Irpex lacteus]